MSWRARTGVAAEGKVAQALTTRLRGFIGEQALPVRAVGEGPRARVRER